MSVTTATGKALDDIGLRYGIRRNGKSDAEYRAHIMQFAIGLGPARGTIGHLEMICARWHEDSPLILELFSEHTVVISTTCTGPDFDSMVAELEQERPAGVRLVLAYDDDLGTTINDVLKSAKDMSLRAGLMKGRVEGAEIERAHSLRFRLRRRWDAAVKRWRS